MIHYQDDLFSLSVLVRSLDLILSTETDPDYFAERVDGDIGFLDRSLMVFSSLLEQNTLLVERAEYLKLLERTVKAFIGVLDRLAGSGYPAPNPSLPIASGSEPRRRSSGHSSYA